MTAILTARTVMAALLLAVAAVLRFGISPLLLDLPADYANETQYAAEDRFRDAPDGEWQSVTVIARRVDQTQVNAGEINVIQGDVHWFTDSGQVIFENAGLYGVDRRTRQNVAGYGDIERSGAFLFPPHLQKTDFTYWDPMFIGARSAVFDHSETINGMTIYVFHFSGTGMDETAGYSYLADVPKRYRTLTDGQGTLWIEPLSGILVDYEERGSSYFVEASSGERLADFHTWSDRYTQQTKEAQLSLAVAARLCILALEVWLPGGLALAGMGVLAWELLRRYKLRRVRP
jgi:hypothetical protein